MLKTISADIGSLGWWEGSSDTILKGNHPRTIPLKFGPNCPSRFRDFNFFPIGSYVKTMSADIDSLGWWAGSLDTILKGDHPRTIPPKSGPNWPSCFKEEDF